MEEPYDNGLATTMFDCAQFNMDNFVDAQFAADAVAGRMQAITDAFKRDADSRRSV